MTLLTLTASNIQGPNRWYWRLTNGDAFVADHEVELDTDAWQFEAYLDLYGYITAHAPPDEWHAFQQQVIRDVGAWMGENVLGASIGAAIASAAQEQPVTVQVTIVRTEDQPGTTLTNGAPTLDRHILFRPLELAHADGKPLALQEVSLVFDTRPDEKPPRRQAARVDTLRMLAVFSLPLGVSALNLRHERYQLRKAISNISSNHGFDVDLRVLQYGVTRAALDEMLAHGDGWDILHFSGHGLASQLVLEKEDGSPDVVATPDLLTLLRPARGRLRWITLSSCLSAAATARETLRWLGIEPPLQQEGDGEVSDAARMPVLANALADELDCGVLAMRFPVGDEFAIALGQSVYEGVLGERQSLGRALQRALPKLCGVSAGDVGHPPLSLGTPALFGRQALDLKLQPAHAADIVASSSGLAYFPDWPKELVGRVSELTRASRALASRSKNSGVLFHGMAGAGKSACAVELARQYDGVPRFRNYVWYKAPDLGKEISGALTHFAAQMEMQIPGLKMVHLVDDARALDSFLPQLADLMRRNSILIVLDNLESLLREDGQWRDERWAGVIDALLAHDGQGRTVLTSRVAPQVGRSQFARRHPVPQQSRPAERLLRLTVHALALDEAALLARQLPNLGDILQGKHAANGFQRNEHRELIRRMLRLVQGHPKLMELAEGQAKDVATLEAHLDRAEDAQLAGEAPLAAFFEEGRSALDEEDFLAKLDGWTTAAVEALDADARRVFEFLCCLEESDRTQQVLVGNWEDYLRRRSGATAPIEPDARKSPNQVVQSLRPAMESLVDCGLVEWKTAGENAEPIYAIHPGVAEAGRRLAGEKVQAAVDTELAAYWRTMFAHGRRNEMSGSGALVREAGLRAAPYLMRRQQWGEASAHLEHVLHRDQSPATIATILPLFRRIVDVAKDTRRELIDVGVLAKAILAAGRWQEAEAMLLDCAAKAEERKEWRTASGALEQVINIMQVTGRSEAALNVVDRKSQATKNAGLGPWTQLGDQALRLQLLNDLGRYKEVLTDVMHLRPTLMQLPEESNHDEINLPWNLRETLLNTGCHAAVLLKQWEMALELSAEIQSSERGRGASDLEQATTRLNDYAPLLGLQRSDEARTIILDCRRTFEKYNSIEGLGKLFSGLADLEDELDHHDRAVEAEKDALRYKYVDGEPVSCAVSHFNLANYLIRACPAAYEETALAHRLACGLLEFMTASGGLAMTLNATARDLAALGTASSAAQLAAEDGGGFEAVVETVERVEGVRFRTLFESLPKDRAATGQEALAKLLTKVRGQSPASSTKVPSDLEETIAAIFGAAAEGKDWKSLIDELHQRLLAEHPDQAEAVGGMIAQLETVIQAQNDEAE